MRSVLSLATILSVMPWLGGCALIPLPPSGVKACLDQGTYMDIYTRQCASKPEPPPARALTAEEQAEKDRFNARVAAREARCTTGSLAMCHAYAMQTESKIYDFCARVYFSDAYAVLGYRRIGWPMEMTAEHMHLSPDLAIPLARAGYSGRWETSGEFAKEAKERCLDGNPF